MTGAVIVALLGCSDDGNSGETSHESGSTESGDADSGDGDGDPGDGDGEPGDGDGEPGDGDGDGDGDGEPGDGDGDGDGEPGDGDGDPGVCDPSAFLGYGIAEDGWGVGDFCDGVFVCADGDVEAQALFDLLGVQCLANEPGCAQGQLQCTLVGQLLVDQDVHDDACAALGVPGIDAVWCVVWGP